MSPQVFWVASIVSSDCLFSYLLKLLVLLNLLILLLGSGILLIDIESTDKAGVDGLAY